MGVVIDEAAYVVKRIFSKRCARCGAKLPGEKVLGRNRDFKHSGERHYCDLCWIDKVTEARAMAKAMLEANDNALDDAGVVQHVRDMIRAVAVASK